MDNENRDISRPERPQPLSAPIHRRTFQFLYEGILDLLRVWILTVYHPRKLYHFLHGDTGDLEVKDQILFGIKEISITSTTQKILGPWQYIIETATSAIVLFTFSVSIMDVVFLQAMPGYTETRELTGIGIVDDFMYALAVTILILVVAYLSALFASIFLNNKQIRKRFIDLAAYGISSATLSVAVSMSIFAPIFFALNAIMNSPIFSEIQGFSLSIVLMSTLVPYAVMMYLFVFFSVELVIRLVIGGVIVLRTNFAQESWRIVCMIGAVVLLSFVMLVALEIVFRAYE